MIELPPILPHHAQPERTSTCMNKVRECDPTWHGRSADNEFVLSRSEVNLIHIGAASLTVLPRTSKFLGVPTFCGKRCHDMRIYIIPQSHPRISPHIGLIFGSGKQPDPLQVD